MRLNLYLRLEGSCLQFSDNPLLMYVDDGMYFFVPDQFVQQQFIDLWAVRLLDQYKKRFITLTILQILIELFLPLKVNQINLIVQIGNQEQDFQQVQQLLQGKILVINRLNDLSGYRAFDLRPLSHLVLKKHFQYILFVGPSILTDNRIFNQLLSQNAYLAFLQIQNLVFYPTHVMQTIFQIFDYFFYFFDQFAYFLQIFVLHCCFILQALAAHRASRVLAILSQKSLKLLFFITKTVRSVDWLSKSLTAQRAYAKLFQLNKYFLDTSLFNSHHSQLQFIQNEDLTLTSTAILQNILSADRQQSSDCTYPFLLRQYQPQKILGKSEPQPKETISPNSQPVVFEGEKGQTSQQQQRIGLHASPQQRQIFKTKRVRGGIKRKQLQISLFRNKMQAAKDLCAICINNIDIEQSTLQNNYSQERAKLIQAFEQLQQLILHEKQEWLYNLQEKFQQDSLSLESMRSFIRTTQTNFNRYAEDVNQYYEDIITQIGADCFNDIMQRYFNKLTDYQQKLNALKDKSPQYLTINFKSQLLRNKIYQLIEDVLQVSSVKKVWKEAEDFQACEDRTQKKGYKGTEEGYLRFFRK